MDGNSSVSSDFTREVDSEDLDQANADTSYFAQIGFPTTPVHQQTSRPSQYKRAKITNLICICSIFMQALESKPIPVNTELRSKVVDRY
jgi:hypothetical protein